MEASCFCAKHASRPYIELTSSTLMSLQKNKRNHLEINRKSFEEALQRELDQKDVDVLTNILKKKLVKSVRIEYCSFLDLHVGDLLQAFSFLMEIHLVSVDLSPNSLKCLTKHAKCVQKLNLSGNPFDENHGNILREFLSVRKSLQYLVVSRCLNTHTLPIVSDGIMKSKTLIGVDLSYITAATDHEPVDGTKIGILVAILLNKKQLVELYLRSCKLQDLTPINEYLARPNPLRVLDISSNHLGPEVEGLMEAIKAGVAVGNTLETLDLSSSCIGKNALILPLTLPFTKIRYLNLSNNKIPADLTTLILQTIRKPYDLKSLCIYGNAFDQTGARILKLLIESGALICDAATTYSTDNVTELLVIPNKDPKFQWKPAYLEQ